MNVFNVKISVFSLVMNLWCIKLLASFEEENNKTFMAEQWYLYTCSKNDVISSVRKHYFALGLGWELRLGLGLGLRKYVFGQTYFRASAIDHWTIVGDSSLDHCSYTRTKNVNVLLSCSTQGSRINHSAFEALTWSLIMLNKIILAIFNEMLWFF